jgi:hypothetical protein
MGAEASRDHVEREAPRAATPSGADPPEAASSGQLRTSRNLGAPHAAARARSPLAPAARSHVWRALRRAIREVGESRLLKS